MASVKDLKIIAKELKIQDYWKMKKSELILAIDYYVHPILYIYAKKDKSNEPVNDDITEKMKNIFNSCKVTGAYMNGNFHKNISFMGIHTCIC